MSDAYRQAIIAQKGEGCRMWGRMQVRVVRVALGVEACGVGCRWGGSGCMMLVSKPSLPRKERVAECGAGCR